MGFIFDDTQAHSLFFALSLVFGKKAMRAAPDIHTEWSDYYAFLSCINRAEGKSWSAQSGKLEHWIDMRRLNKLYGTGLSRRALFPKLLSHRRKSAGNRTAYTRIDV